MILMFIEKIMKMHNTLVSYGVIVVKGLCKDKTTDERFFILSLFAIAEEIEAQGAYTSGLMPIDLREDGAAFGLVHSGAEQVFHIMNRNNHRRAGCVKGTEQIFTAAAHSALAVAALDIDGVAPVAACGAQELAEMRIGGSKTGNGQNITPISNCAQRNNSAQFL